MEMNIYGIFTLVAGISALYFGLIVYARNRKDLINKTFALLSIGFSIWTFSYFIWLLQGNTESGLFWSRMLNLGATLIPPFYLHWILSFLGLNKKKRWLILFAYFITVVFVIFSFSPLYIKEVKPMFGFPYWPQAGLLYSIFLIISFFGFDGYALMELIRKYYQSEKEKKIQIRYLIGATIIGFGGGITNFPLMYGIPLMPPYGMFLIIFYPLLLYYAVAKHHLFNVRVIATELFTVTIWLLLLSKLFFSIGYQDFIINISILLSVIIVGVLLIRSVVKEVEQKEKMEKMAQDIERAYEVEKKANEKLEKLDKYKNDFLTQTQHDLRSPLSVLMGYSDLLLGGSYGKLPKKAADIIEKMQIVVQNKVKDINNFLDVEQFRIGKGVVSLKPCVELLPILEEIINVINPKAQSKGIYLKLQKPPSFAEATAGEGKMISISADTEKLKAALFNIIDNALKYTEKGGVDIKVESNENNIRIIVSDTGIGISPDKIKNIFETQFGRAEQAKKIAGGSGVGLYLSSQIIKLHNGKVWAESEGEGKGSIFFIELPVGGK